MAKDGVIVIEIWSSSDEEDESPLRTLFRSPTKKNFAIKEEKKKRWIDDDDDCFILDFDPFESIDLSSKLSIIDEAQEVSIVAERGQVACRDYPHSRHLCGKFPFNETPHSSYCEKCYCYVCDSNAPCESWSDGISMGHCHATENDPKWKNLRRFTRTVPAA